MYVYIRLEDMTPNGLSCSTGNGSRFSAGCLLNFKIVINSDPLLTSHFTFRKCKRNGNEQDSEDDWSDEDGEVDGRGRGEEERGEESESEEDQDVVLYVSDSEGGTEEGPNSKGAGKPPRHENGRGAGKAFGCNLFSFKRSRLSSSLSCPPFLPISLHLIPHPSKERLPAYFITLKNNTMM